VAIALALSMLAGPARADGDDIVFLKNGGRVRGVVMLEDPKQGVKVKLGDGSVHEVPAADVDHIEYAKPAPPPAPVPLPPAPVAAPPAPVAVPPAAVAAPPAPVAAPPAPPPEGPRYVHVGVAFQPGGTFLLSGGFAYVGMGLAVFGAFDVTPSVSLRAAGFAGALGGESALIPLGGSLGLDVAPGAGHLLFGGALRGGAMLFAGSNATTTVPFFGVEATPIGVRVGADDSFELRFVTRLDVLFPSTPTGFALSTPAQTALEPLVSVGYRFR
jgi:hypothetical protein